MSTSGRRAEPLNACSRGRSMTIVRSPWSECGIGAKTAISGRRHLTLGKTPTHFGEDAHRAILSVVHPPLQDRKADDVDPAPEPELPHRVGLVDLDRLDAEVELRGDLL